MEKTRASVAERRTAPLCVQPSRRRFVQASLAVAALGLLSGSGCMAVPTLPWSGKRIPRVGFLSPNAAGPAPTTDAFLGGLRDLGYVEGQSITIDWRFAE